MSRMLLAIAGAALLGAAAIAANAASTMPGSAGIVAAQGSSRVSEPIALTGAEISGFRGAPAAELWAWAWVGGQWRLMHSQLDERDDAGGDVSLEDGALDDNDMFVLTSDELGARWPGGANPPGMPADSPPADVSVTDPLAPGYEGHAYLYRSPTGPGTSLEPLVTMDEAAAEIRSASYTLGFARAAADGFVGLKRLSLHGRAEDLLDRLKIRLTVVAFGLPLPMNEQGIAQYGLEFVPTPVTSGPVRLVLNRAGDSYACGGRLAIPGDLRTLDVPSLFQVTDIRVSLDFSSAAVPGSYSDTNVPAGVPIDGRPDSVPASPLPAWRQIDTPAGRIAMLATGDIATSKAMVYYKDDATLDIADTGDMLSYADNGVAGADLPAIASAGFPGVIVVPPLGDAVTAAQLLEQSRRPLIVTVSGGPATPTPGPTSAVTRTPTATAPRPATRTPTVTPAATEAPQSRLFLPSLFDNGP